MTRSQKDAGMGVDPAGQAPAPLPGPVAPHRRQPQEAEQAPPITQDYLLQYIRDAQATSRFPDFGLAPAFSGQIGQGNKLTLSFNMPNPGDASVDLMVGEALGAALDASEDLADTLMHTTASTFTPGVIRCPDP